MLQLEPPRIIKKGLNLSFKFCCSDHSGLHTRMEYFGTGAFLCTVSGLGIYNKKHTCMNVCACIGKN